MTFDMSKIHSIIVIIDQHVAPNRRAMEEPEDVLTFNLYQSIFFQQSVP